MFNIFHNAAVSDSLPLGDWIIFLLKLDEVFLSALFSVTTALLVDLITGGFNSSMGIFESTGVRTHSACQLAAYEAA